MRNAGSLPVYLALAALLPVGAYVRVHGAGGYYYNSDEAAYVHIAAAKTLAEAWSLPRYEMQPPLPYLLSHCWMIISDDPSFVRGLSLLFGLATIYLFYQDGRAAIGHITGVACAALATFSHALIILSFSVLQYAPFLFFMTAAFYYFVRLNRKPDLRKLLCYAGCSLAACMSHFSAMLTLACIAVTGTLILLRKRARFSMHASWVAVHLVVVGVTLIACRAWEPFVNSMKPFFDAATFRALSPLGARVMAALTFPFVVGDYLFQPKVYNEFSHGQQSTQADYALRGATEFNLGDFPFMIEGEYRHFDYFHGDGLVTNPGRATQSFVPASNEYDDDVDGRIGLKLLDPRIYLAVSYLNKRTSASGPQVVGPGLGLEKLPDYEAPLGVYFSAYYYPNLVGQIGVGPNQAQLAVLRYRVLTYQLGFTLKPEKSPIFIDLGALGDRMTARGNAPSNETHLSPYAGIGFFSY